MQNINVVRIKNLHLMENQRPKCTVYLTTTTKGNFGGYKNETILRCITLKRELFRYSLCLCCDAI